MTIYLDYIFIENLLIDYILLKQTSYISRKKVSRKRACLASTIASLYVVIMIWLKIEQLEYLICKILLTFIVIYVCFNPKTINEYIRIMILFFLISVLNVGTFSAITNLINVTYNKAFIKIIVYVISLFISKFFVTQTWKIYMHNIRNEELIYDVKIYLNQKQYAYKAFLDTGNNVYSYTYDVPVIFAQVLNEDIWEELKAKTAFEITTTTLSSTTNKKAYVFDNVEISNGRKKWNVKAAIVFEREKLSKDNSYNMLLNYILYVQNLGGIKI